MKATSALFLLGASLAFTTAVSAGHLEKAPSRHETAKESPEVELEVDQLVAGRRSAYWMSAGLMGGMFGVMNSGGDVAGLEFPARALAGWATALPGMFPEGSASEKSNALPAVWEEREEFEALAALYSERANELAEIAKSGDKEAFKAQWEKLRETCASCHNKFRRDRSKEAQGQ